MAYLTEWQLNTNPKFTCRQCNSINCLYRIWESWDEAHEDYEYKCKDCGKHWWIEGSDC